MQELRQSTAVDVLIGPFVDSTDGVTAETGLTIAAADVRLSANGQNIVAKNDGTACAHDEIGLYNCELDATDTATLGMLTLNVQESGALPVRHEYMVLTAEAWDAKYVANASGIIATGTAQTTYAVGTLNLEAGSWANDDLIGATAHIYAGTCAGQSRIIHDFAATGEVCSVAPDWANQAPDGTSKYIIIASAPANTSEPAEVNVTQWLGTAAGTPNTAGIPLVDTVRVSGTAQTANDNAADINTLITQVGTAGAGLTNLGGMSTGMKAEVNAEADTALTDYDPPTKAELDVLGTAALATEAKQDTIDTVVDSILAGTVTNAQGADVATDVAAMIDANNRVDVGSWLGTAVTTSATSNKPEVDVNSVSDDATAANNLEAAYDGTGYDIGGMDVSEVNDIMDAWIDGGRLDLLIDAIKVATDKLTFTVANQVDANVQSINDVTITGDGSGTPFNV